MIHPALVASGWTTLWFKINEFSKTMGVNPCKTESGDPRYLRQQVVAGGRDWAELCTIGQLRDYYWQWVKIYPNLWAATEAVDHKLHYKPTPLGLRYLYSCPTTGDYRYDAVDEYLWNTKSKSLWGAITPATQLKRYMEIMDSLEKAAKTPHA